MARYECIARNQFLCTHTKTFDEFIKALEDHVEMLKLWRSRGIQLDEWHRRRLRDLLHDQPRARGRTEFEEGDWIEEEYDLKFAEREAAAERAAARHKIERDALAVERRSQSGE